MPDPGWYRDPQDPTSEEYWDGYSWTGARRPSTAELPNADQRTVQSPYGGYTPGYPAPPAYGPDYQQPDYQQPDYQQPEYQQPEYQQPEYQQPGYGQPGYGEPTASPRRRKLPLIIGGVLVVLVAVGLTTFFLVSGGSSPSLTYDGKQIASADAVLARAEKAVARLVSAQHGAKSGDTRCYFVQPTKPAPGAKSSNISDSLRCGPVLFVDGNAAAEYLTVPLTASTTTSPVHLSADTSALFDAKPAAVPHTLMLVRPDGATPPSGNGGLHVPQPPPAPKDALVSAVLSGNAPKDLSNAKIVSKDQDVTLTAAGVVSRYGTGSDARSAPAGQQLIAFQLESGPGAISSGGTAQPTLVLDGRTRDIPAASGNTWDVAAVPTGSSPVIQLKADGYTQTLALPGGMPGSNNIAVLTRQNTSTLLDKSFTIRCTYSKNGASLNAKLTVSVPNADLYFWVPDFPGAHPQGPESAYLSVNVTFLDSSTPGKRFGFEPDLLRLTLPDGTALTPHNVAGKKHRYDVFAVPADYTTGVFTISGSTVLTNGVRQTLHGSKSFHVHIGTR